MTDQDTRMTPKAGRKRHRPAGARKASLVQEAPALPSIDSGKVAHPRQTLPTNANILGSLPYAFLPRRQYNSIDLSTLNVSALSPQQLIDLLSDSDPDVSLAWWNFLLLSCGGWKVDVRTADDKEDPAGQDQMNTILSTVNARWGGFDNLLYQWTMSILLEGACCGETVPSDTFDGVHDIVPVTPWTIYFQRDSNQDLVVYQWQPMVANGMTQSFYEPPTPTNIANASYGAAGFRLLNTTTFGYVPFMPMVDDPYGRMPFASVFQIIVFDNQLLQDLRRWAHVNAWGRIDVSVLQEAVQNLMPPAVKANFPDSIKFVNQYLADVAKTYDSVGPDDTFIHYDNVKIGSVDATGKTLNIDNLIRAVERKKFRSLRMLPILMGSNEGTTETHGTVQWDIMARGIQSIQKCVITLANSLLTVGLRLYGSTSHAQLEFEQIRTTDRMADAQAEAVAIKNAALKRDEGWITQDEASIEITGSPAVAKAPDPDSLIAPTMSPPVEGDFSPPEQEPSAPAKTAAKNEAPITDDKGNSTDDEDRAFLRSALQEYLADMVQIRSKATKKPTRTALTSTLTTKLATHFSSLSVSMGTIRKLVETHTNRSRFRSNSRHLPEDFFVACRHLIAVRDGTTPTPLTGKQRDTLKASLAAAMASDIPDDDQDLTDDIDGTRLDAYGSGAQDGLTAIKISGDFSLTNATILAGLAAYATTFAQGIQQTTRNQLATTTLQTLEDGGDADAVSAAIDARLAAMGETRAPSIAGYVVSGGYWLGSTDAWSHNGVTQKTWVTDGDPDPGAGATGETPCRDNAYGSPVDINDSFPSGDDAPPAHGDCQCGLAAASDASDDALDDPWLGD